MSQEVPDSSFSDEAPVFPTVSDSDEATRADQTVPISARCKRRCIAPLCSSDDRENITFHRFPHDEERLTKWISQFPSMQWKFCKTGRLCSKHFLPSCYKTNSTDSNERRTQLDIPLKKTFLKNDAIPTLWPNVPANLLKNVDTVTPRPTNLSSASSRRESVESIAKQMDKIEDIQSLNEADIILPERCFKHSTKTFIAFTKIDVTEKPKVLYCLKIFNSLQFEVWLRDKKVLLKDIISDMNEEPHVLDSFDTLKNTIQVLDDYPEEIISHEQHLEVVAEKLLFLFPQNPKVYFLCEQLLLLTKNPHQRRYSPKLLAMACMWESTSSVLYRLIVAEDLLTLPGEKYVNRLSSAIKIDFDLNDSAIAYMKARMATLSPRDLHVCLILDEVFNAESIQYTYGTFFGFENAETPTKRLLCVMLKSIAGPYRDVIAMSPMTVTSAEIVCKVWKNVVKHATEIGFDVCATTLDNHRSNMKMYQKLLCNGELKSSIPHPLIESKKIFLLFDSTHLLKCVYNNFREREGFVIPNEEGQWPPNLYPNFHDIKLLMDIELGKPLKIAHKLTDKVVNPLALEKTNVSLADAVFHESTINALRTYEKKVPGFSQTADFLERVREWWDRFNVKSKFKGEHKRKNSMKPINKENIDEFAESMLKFCAWLTNWRTTYPDFCISSPTYKALMQTTRATVDLCHYLLENDNDISYVLLGFLQQDWLEGRFGWYRQLCGGNYYASVLQFLQAEKTIRLRNLVKSGYNMAEIAKIFSEVDYDETAKQQSLEFSDLLSHFRFSRNHNDVSITYYVAGYISRGITKKTKCKDCRSLFSDGGSPLTVQWNDVGATEEELEEGKSFLSAINRGGLIKPSDILYITCLHAAELYRFIKDDYLLRKKLIGSRNSRSLFVEVFIRKLDEFDHTKKILSAQCQSKHDFRTHVRHVTTVMFNLFAKNLAAELNNVIHQSRKRKGVDEESVEGKRDMSNMKSKKLKSSS